MVKTCEFVSVWNGGEICKTTSAKYDSETNLVFDIEITDDVDDLDVLDREYAVIDGASYCILDNDDGTYSVLY